MEEPSKPSPWTGRAGLIGLLVATVGSAAGVWAVVDARNTNDPWRQLCGSNVAIRDDLEAAGAELLVAGEERSSAGFDALLEETRRLEAAASDVDEERIKDASRIIRTGWATFPDLPPGSTQQTDTFTRVTDTMGLINDECRRRGLPTF